MTARKKEVEAKTTRFPPRGKPKPDLDAIREGINERHSASLEYLAR